MVMPKRNKVCPRGNKIHKVGSSFFIFITVLKNVPMKSRRFKKKTICIITIYDLHGHALIKEPLT